MFERLLMLGLFKIFRPEEADKFVDGLKNSKEEDENEDDDDDVLDDIIELLTKVRDAK